MTTRAVGIGSGIGWLKQAVNLGRNNPKAIFGAVALMAVVALIPSVLQLVLQYAFKANPEAIMVVVAVITLASVVIYPPMIGGVLRVVDAAEKGESTQATAVFEAFRADNGRNRMIGFGLLMFAVYMIVFVLVISLFGQDFMHWYFDVITKAQEAQASGQPPQLGALPPDFGTLMGIGSLFALFMGGVYTLGFGQVALGGRGVVEALKDGVAGTLKNVLPIVVLTALAVVGMFALAIGFGLVAGVLMLVASAVSKALGMMLLVPLYLGLILVVYVVMFGVMYAMWRDVCGDGAVAPRVDDHIEA